MNDTQEVKNTLVALKSTIDSEITGKVAQSGALQIALDLIENRLQTQSIELENKYKEQINTLQTENDSLATEKEAIKAQKETLEAQLADTQTVEDSIIEATPAPVLNDIIN